MSPLPHFPANDQTPNPATLAEAPRLLEILKPRRRLSEQSHDCPVHAAELQRRVFGGGQDEQVRGLISYLRSESSPEIGSTARGYFWCVTVEDYQATIDHLEARVSKVNRIIDNMKFKQSLVAAKFAGKLL